MSVSLCSWPSRCSHNGPMDGGATVAGIEALHGLPLPKAGPVIVTSDVLTTEIKDELLIWYHFSRSPAIHLSPSWCPQAFITLYGTVIHPFWNWSHQIFTGLSGTSANIIPVFTECLFTVMGAYLTAFQTRNLILQWRRCGNGHMSIESSRLTISHITWEWNRRLDWPMGPFTPQLESVGHRHPWARAFQGTQVLWVLVFP